MFSDYRKYLLRIRNNLIQCGVEFPVERVSSYREVFELGCKLEEVLWYYSILEVSGSEDALRGFFLPLNGYYRDRVRRLSYLEFSEFLKDYDKISVSGRLKAKKSVEKLKEELESSSKIYGDMVELSEIGEGVEVTHGRYVDDEDTEDEKASSVEENIVDEDLENLENSEVLEGVLVDAEWVSHGCYVEDDYPYSKSNEKSEECDFEEDTSRAEESLDDDEWHFEDEPVEGTEDTDDDDEPWEFEDEPEEFGVGESIEDDKPWEFEDDDYVGVVEDDEEPWEFEDEPEESVEESTEDDEEPWDFEEDPSEESIEDDEEPWEFEDEPEDAESVEDDEEPWEFEEDEAETGSDSDSEDEEPWEFEDDESESGVESDSEDEEPWEFEDDEEGTSAKDEEPFEFEEDEDPIVEPASAVREKGSDGLESKVDSPEVNKRDLSDTLQDFTNGFLTSVKRAAVKGIKKLEK